LRRESDKYQTVNGAFATYKKGFGAIFIGLLTMPLQGNAAVTSTDLYQCAAVSHLSKSDRSAHLINATDPTIDSGGIGTWTNWGQGRPFFKIELDTFDPQAVCNDGSPAVMYVR